MTTLLLCVAVALPVELKELPHIYHQVNEFLVPETIDSAVYNRFQRVVRLHGATRPWTVGAMDGSATNGHLDIVQWLLSKRSEGCSEEALNGAAANGHLAVVKLLCNKKQKQCDYHEALKRAAANGHVETVTFLRTTCDDEIMVGAAFLEAATNGHVDAMRLLDPRDIVDANDALRNAAANGHAGVIEYIFQITGRLQDFKLEDFAMTLYLKAVHGEGSSTYFAQRQFHSEYGSTGVEIKVAVWALVAAAENGHMNVVKLLIARCGREQIGFVIAAIVGSHKKLTKLVEMLMEAYEPSSSCFDAEDLVEVDLKNSYACSAHCIGLALLAAATSNNVDMVRVLAPKSPTCSKLCTLFMAERNGFDEIGGVLAENTRECSIHLVSGETAWTKLIGRLIGVTDSPHS